MANKVKFRYGICQNSHVEETGKPCPLCQSKEVQRVIATKELICSECKGKLKEIPRPKTFWEKYGTLIIAAVALLIIGGGVACYTLVGGSDEPTGIKHEEKVTIEEPKATPPPTQQMLIKQLSIDGGDFSIKVGESKQLTFVVDPEKHDEILSWVSDNETVATVDNTGKVSAIKKGTATIKVAADKSGTNATVKVTVKPEEKPEPIGILRYGKYSGGLKNGQPDGTGKLTFTKPYQLNAQYTAQPGEYIQGIFENGKPTFVTYYQKDGTVTKIKLR
jgi:hypothetical protein